MRIQSNPDVRQAARRGSTPATVGAEPPPVAGPSGGPRPSGVAERFRNFRAPRS